MLWSDRRAPRDTAEQARALRDLRRVWPLLILAASLALVLILL